jgi:hypothetical protein
MKLPDAGAVSPLYQHAHHGAVLAIPVVHHFRFTGALNTVTVELSGDLITGTDSEMLLAMAHR